MDNVSVLLEDNHVIGVYTSHRKAIQAMLSHTLTRSYKLTEYLFEFDIEYYTFQDDYGHQSNWELQEITPEQA